MILFYLLFCGRFGRSPHPPPVYHNNALSWKPFETGCYMAQKKIRINPEPTVFKKMELVHNKTERVDTSDTNMLSHAAILCLCTLAIMSSLHVYQPLIFQSFVPPGEYYMLSLLRDSIISAFCITQTQTKTQTQVKHHISQPYYLMVEHVLSCNNPLVMHVG